MPLPNFLIIGAMKAGTTSLYRDLALHSQVFFPEDKEPGNLAHDSVLTSEGRTKYEQLFKRAEVGQLCGDASTDYTKLPDVPGVPLRAWQVLGEEAKLIYLVRDPIRRAISHHYHEYSRGQMPANFEEALAGHPQIIDFGRYALQAEPWLKQFPSSQMLWLRFEDFIADRQATIERVVEFLELAESVADASATAHNSSEEAVVLKEGMLRRFQQSSVYRGIIRRFIPLEMRDQIRRKVLPKAPPKPPPPPRHVLEQLREAFHDDGAQLASLLDWPQPIWDLQQTIDKIHPPQTSATSA